MDDLQPTPPNLTASHDASFVARDSSAPPEVVACDVAGQSLPLLRLRVQAGRCTIECLACMMGPDVQVVVAGGQECVEEGADGAREDNALLGGNAGGLLSGALACGSLPGSHVGSVALAQPRASLTGVGKSATVSTLNLCGHKDDAVANSVANRVSAQTGAVVCCTCGIHVDGASPQEIQAIVAAVDRMVGCIVEFVQDARERLARLA